MNEDTLSGKWKEIKGEIRNQWGRLTDDELESVKGNVGAIAGLIQQRYGDAKEGLSEKLHSLFARFDAKADNASQDVKSDAVNTTESVKQSLRDSSKH